MAHRTYHGTLFNPDLTEAVILLYFTDNVKHSKVYGLTDEEDKPIKVTGVKSWTIVEGGDEAKLCEKFVDEKDENDEYLILNFTDKIEVYRNSHVTMFIH